MNWLPVANLVLGLAGAQSRNRAAAAQARLAEQNRKRVEDLQFQDYDRRLGAYQDNAAGGAYNVQNQQALNERIVGNDLRRNVGNLEVAAGARGYHPADTRIEQGKRSLSERASLGLAQLNQNTARQVQGDRMRDLSFASPGNLTSLMGGYERDRARADATRVDFGDLIGGAIAGGAFGGGQQSSTQNQQTSDPNVRIDNVTGRPMRWDMQLGRWVF